MGMIIKTMSEGYAVAANALGTEPNAPLTSAPGLESRHPTMVMVGGY